MRFLAIVAVLFSLVLLAFAANPQSPKVEVPTLLTDRDQFGGRPGTFHFVTNEQTMSDAATLKQAFAALDRLDASVATLDKNTRVNLSADLQVLRQFTTDVHSRRSGSAGKTAGQIEVRLNEAKGKFMCGACHGHGMMHGGGMGMGMGPMRNNN
jgi:hypothetical protein